MCYRLIKILLQYGWPWLTTVNYWTVKVCDQFLKTPMDCVQQCMHVCVFYCNGPYLYFRHNINLVVIRVGAAIMFIYCSKEHSKGQGGMYMLTRQRFSSISKVNPGGLIMLTLFPKFQTRFIRWLQMKMLWNTNERSHLSIMMSVQIRSLEHVTMNMFWHKSTLHNNN